MTGQSRSITFGVGWMRQAKNGSEYISAAVGKKNGAQLKLLIEDENGHQVVVDNFAVFFNEEKNNEKSPDVRFVFTQRE